MIIPLASALSFMAAGVNPCHGLTPRVVSTPSMMAADFSLRLPATSPRAATSSMVTPRAATFSMVAPSHSHSVLARVPRARGTLITLPAVPTGAGRPFSWQRELDHAILPQRVVRVWLPPGYSEDDEVGFPTLYCHDGQYMISDGPRDWKLDRSVARLYKAGAMARPPVVVLIDNCRSGDRSRLGDVNLGPLVISRRRWLEYSDNPIGRRYIAWLCDDLKPEIDRLFNTCPGPESTAALGSSMGGLAAFLGLWWRPDVFGGAAALSPVFQSPLLAEVAREAPARLGSQKRIYIDNGGDTPQRKTPWRPVDADDAAAQGVWWLDTSLQPGVDAMCAALDLHGIPYTYHREPGGRHNEAAWAARVDRPLRCLFGQEGKEGGLVQTTRLAQRTRPAAARPVVAARVVSGTRPRRRRMAA